MDKITNHGTGFTQVPNGLIYNNEIPATAKALFCYMASRPNGWKFYKSEILKNFKEGKTAIDNAMKCLIDWGYIKREQVKVNGKFSHNSYTVIYLSQSGFPCTDEPSTDNQPLIILNNTNTDNNKKTKQKKFEEWYSEYPRKVGRKNAEKAYEKAIKEIEHEKLIELTRKLANHHEQQGTDKQYIPHPATWLNRAGWEDELTAGGLSNNTTNNTTGQKLCSSALARKAAFELIAEKRMERDSRRSNESYMDY